MLESLDTPTPRRGFLTRFATVAAGLGLSTSVAACAKADSTPPADPAKPSTAADPALEAWFGKITGKHKQLFDAPEPNDGMPAIWPRVYLNTMGATYPGEAATAVVVLRHGAIPLAMTDALWAKYKFGEMFSIKDPKGAAATSNIYAKIEGLPISGLGIAELLAGGVLVGACDVALTIYSSQAATKMKMDPAEVKKEWIAGLIPGVQVVPSGVMAVGHTQELGCTYCFAG